MHPHFSSLYVSRPLLNTKQLLKWAMEQGFRQALHPEDMHVTLAFSHKPVGWHQLQPILEPLQVTSGERSVSPLGERGAMVLHFDHPHLSQRWQQLTDAGAEWQFPSFKPHVTLTYSGGGLDPQMIEPYWGPLIFGPEKFAPLDPNWDQKLEEIPLIAENIGVFPSKLYTAVKYGESITEITRMTELSSLLMNNIDLILEAYNVDGAGNLVVANSKKVKEADEVFHKYFVKSMNHMFRQINENDPIMQEPNSMALSPHGIDDLGGGDMMGAMQPMGMGHGEEGEDAFGMGEPGGEHPMHMGMHGGEMSGDDMYGQGGDMYGQGDMHGGEMHGGEMHSGHGHMHGGHHMGESADYDWLFNEEADLDVDALFDLTEDEQLDEFMGHHGDDMMGGQMGGQGGAMGGSMDQMGGANDFGGDMGGMGSDMDLDSADDHGMGNEMGGDEGDMVTIHGTTDEGGDFEFSFDPETLGFDDLGHDDMGGMDMGHEEHHGGGEEHHGGGEHHHEPKMDHMEEPGMGEDEEKMEEAAQNWHNGKPGKGKRGAKSARMGIVPADPAVNHAAPFPTPQGAKQKRK